MTHPDFKLLTEAGEKMDLIAGEINLKVLMSETAINLAAMYARGEAYKRLSSQVREGKEEGRRRRREEGGGRREKEEGEGGGRKRGGRREEEGSMRPRLIWRRCMPEGGIQEVVESGMGRGRRK
jgi:hypothetical protein